MILTIFSSERYNIIISVQYTVTATIYKGDYKDPQSDEDQYLTMRGTLADTEEVRCDADFSIVEGEKICTLTSNVNIGEFRCIRWRLGGSASDVDGLRINTVEFNFIFWKFLP